MVFVVHPSDYTTSFFSGIYSSLEKHGIEISINPVLSNEESHNACIEKIRALNPGTPILFIGHGSKDGLFGAEQPGFPRKIFISKDNVEIFSSKDIFCFSCQSHAFLSPLSLDHDFGYVGFSDLPTSEEEADDLIGLNGLVSPEIEEIIMSRFNYLLRDIITECLLFGSRNTITLNQLKAYLSISFNQKMSYAIKKYPGVEGNSMAKLLYHVREGIGVG